MKQAEGTNSLFVHGFACRCISKPEAKQETTDVSIPADESIGDYEIEAFQFCLFPTTAIDIDITCPITPNQPNEDKTAIHYFLGRHKYAEGDILEHLSLGAQSEVDLSKSQQATAGSESQENVFIGSLYRPTNDVVDARHPIAFAFSSADHRLSERF